jgi:hypothetical protein
MHAMTHRVGPSWLLIGSIALAISGCGGDGTFGSDDDDSNSGRALDVSYLSPALVLAPYSAGIRVQGWGGEPTFAVEAGTLPPGLELTAAGVVQGTPTWLGSWTVTVRASGMSFPDSVGPVTIPVVDDGTVGLGFTHDQLNNMQDIDGGPLMNRPWLRIGGGGEPGMDTWTMEPGLYAAGPNGVHELGYGDDVLVGELEDGAVTLSVQEWLGATPEWDTNDPATLQGMTATAHGDTGTLTLQLAHPDWRNEVVEVIAVPPDWCPMGEHPGGAWSPGQCE